MVFFAFRLPHLGLALLGSPALSCGHIHLTRKTVMSQPPNFSQRPEVKLKRLPHAKDLPLPRYQSHCAAGADLMAALPENSPVILKKTHWHLVPTGFAIELPEGFEAQVRPRSGLAYKHGITVLNSPGTIDADYRGEIKVLLINHGSDVFRVTHAMRIAQLIIAPVSQAVFTQSDDLGDSARGTKGFGSTGT